MPVCEPAGTLRACALACPWRTPSRAGLAAPTHPFCDAPSHSTRRRAAPAPVRLWTPLAGTQSSSAARWTQQARWSGGWRRAPASRAACGARCASKWVRRALLCLSLCGFECSRHCVKPARHADGANGRTPCVAVAVSARLPAAMCIACRLCGTLRRQTDALAALQAPKAAWCLSLLVQATPRLPGSPPTSCLPRLAPLW